MIQTKFGFHNELNIKGYTFKNARKDRRNKKKRGVGLIAYFANHIKYERVKILESE
jgi:hypothetical protein